MEPEESLEILPPLMPLDPADLVPLVFPGEKFAPKLPPESETPKLEVGSNFSGSSMEVYSGS